VKKLLTFFNAQHMPVQINIMEVFSKSIKEQQYDKRGNITEHFLMLNQLWDKHQVVNIYYNGQQTISDHDLKHELQEPGILNQAQSCEHMEEYSSNPENQMLEPILPETFHTEKYRFYWGCTTAIFAFHQVNDACCQINLKSHGMNANFKAY
jgi:hypothetical protein